ncbi:MAG TPA: zinc-dependent alcohol dehydrogenase family protein [Casimicrobiaceae bacterium]|nr:zinc-dependent alcohol dehydrogenase family protein [Casimicrobiaceae bacterium]
MQAMVLEAPGRALKEETLPRPSAGPGQVLIAVRACGVCRTDLHLVDGELPDPRLPIVPGHEIVGTVVERGSGVAHDLGVRVGVPWLGATCGHCAYCTSGRENLCGEARFTGYQIDGGYAQYALADARYCFALPRRYRDVEAAPLLCAGLIGYRAYRLAGDAPRLGIYGFGAAAHLIAQVALAQGREVFAFTRPGDADGQAFARQLGASWAGGSDEVPPVALDAALIFAPAGALVPAALSVLARGGTAVCAGIHMSDVPSFPYRLLWGERSLRSVANLTRQDARDFLSLADATPLAVHARPYPLADANVALADLRAGSIEGAAVLTIEG